MSWTEEEYKQFQRERGTAAFQDAQKAAKPSKYRNIKVMVDGERFDSKREYAYWQELKLREKAGEITDLHRQVALGLYCPSFDLQEGAQHVSDYLADFTFQDHIVSRTRYVDIKGGKETALFTLKRKWVFLQTGIEIEVIR